MLSVVANRNAIALRNSKTFFSKIITSLYETDETNWVWIGLNDLEAEGTFVFLDGMKATQENSGWRHGQPDNHKGNEDCAQIYVNQVHIWNVNKANDASCSSSCFALCEKPLKLM